MDLDAIARRFARPRKAAATTPEREPEPDVPPWLEAREERAAIMQFDGGLTRQQADAEAARLHPDPGALAGPWHGVTRAELEAAAGPDWPDIADRPETLECFARLLSTHWGRCAPRFDHD